MPNTTWDSIGESVSSRASARLEAGIWEGCPRAFGRGDELKLGTTLGPSRFSKSCYPNSCLNPCPNPLRSKAKMKARNRATIRGIHKT